LGGMSISLHPGTPDGRRLLNGAKGVRMELE
jgi:hypothetical protein